jgi:hypothetical protein
MLSLVNRVGPFGALESTSDIAAARADGFNLTVLSSSSETVRNDLTASQFAYLDGELWKYIHDRCSIQFEFEARRGSSMSCQLSAQDEAVIQGQVDTRLRWGEHNPNIVGYWVLDDYPYGDVSDALRGIHSAVALSNARSGASRVLVCGVGGLLDLRLTAGGPLVQSRRYTIDALVNVVPDACDVVAPYFYAVGPVNDPSLVDWAMSDLMPWFMAELKARGFDQPPLLPIVQAFSTPTDAGKLVYIEPRPADMAAQASAYCSRGAIALLYFAWWGRDLEKIYRNDAQLRLGVASAADACRAVGLELPTVAPGSS